MSEPQQPEYVWAFPPEKPRGGRGWLVGILIVVAVAIAAAMLLLFLRPWATADPAPTPSASASPSATPSASDTPTPTPTPTPSASATATATPSPPATATPSAPADPALPVFRGKVQPLLDDAVTGLTYARDSDAQEGVQLMDQLQGDAGRMSDAVAPSSIAKAWGTRVSTYGTALDRLRTAFETGAATAGPLSSAQSALAQLQDLVDG
ncbi:hypothetical protein [Microbacterium sp. H1-D42]|uniref:hypothetical protein n=1 Tax=Microbacterium sp. H1-D42 TaxID=2925844 RepID=UPI001F533377|nr:hypothetical protein [Microbacterium sp. H1-D42]UNK69711.1 hypothetical protein MNR00_11070 [Microbacterium sp. H1-D42]